MYSKLLLVSISIVLFVLPVASIAETSEHVDYVYEYSYKTGVLKGLQYINNNKEYDTRSVIVGGVIQDKSIIANCEYNIIGEPNKELLSVNFTNSPRYGGPNCILDIYNKTEDDETNTDIDDIKSRTYCMAAFGPRYVPHLKYELDESDKLVLSSATCISNRHQVGDQEQNLEMICKMGIKDTNFGSGKCRACIEKTDKINTQIEGLLGPNSVPSIPGVDCNIYAPETSPMPTPRPDATNAASTTSDNRAGSGSAPPVNYAYTPPPQIQRQPQQQPRQPQPRQPQQQPPKQKTLWDNLKEAFTRGGGQQPRQDNDRARPKPECSVFIALDTEIKEGESTRLQWALEYSSSAYITPGIGLVNPVGGAVSVAPEHTTTYTMQLHNRNGYGNCDPITVTVSEPVEDTDDEDVEDGAGDPLITCSPSNVRTGGRGTVSWQCPRSASSSEGSSTEYSSFGTRGERVGSVYIKNMIKDGKFVIRCKDEDGDEIGRNSCDIQVNAELYDGTSDSDDNQPKANITANETQVTAGDIVTIAWRGDNTDNCTITGPDGFREYGNKGSVTGRILQTSTFQLSCISSGVLLPIEEITIVAN